ncbi:MAG: hypothetical protein ACLQJR_17390 [Stellaceae bacterium]
MERRPDTLGAKRALKPRQVWAIRFWLDRERRVRDRAMFDLAYLARSAAEFTQPLSRFLLWFRHRAAPPRLTRRFDCVGKRPKLRGTGVPRAGREMFEFVRGKLGQRGQKLAETVQAMFHSAHGLTHHCQKFFDVPDSREEFLPIEFRRYRK